MNAKLQSGRLSGEITIDPIRIHREDKPERRIDHRHHHLEFDPRACPEAGIRTGKESNLFFSDLPFAVDDLPCQFILSQHPGIADVEIGCNREDSADDGNSVLDVHDTLSVASNINNIVERPCNTVAGFGIDDAWITRCTRISVANDERDGTDRTEIETPDIEIAAEEVPLIVRNRRSVESLNKRAEETDSEYIPSFVHRMEITVVQGRTEVVYSSAQKSAGVFKRQ